MITIVGSSDMPISKDIAAAIVGILSMLDVATEAVGIRARLNSHTFSGAEPSSPVEAMVADLTRTMGGRVENWHNTTVGGRGNFVRDRNMVRASRQVYAFLSESVLQEQLKGTRKDDVLGGGVGHVITVAIQENIPLESYVVGSNGVPIFLGGWP